MKHVRDVMDIHPVLVTADLPVADLARRLLEADADGACVVEDGRLVGVVTSMDVVFREKKVHLPTVIAFMDALIPLESAARTRKELEKITGADVGDIMTRDVYTAAPDAPVDEVATRMVEDHHSFVPVLDGDEIVGAVTRKSMLRAAAGRSREV